MKRSGLSAALLMGMLLADGVAARPGTAVAQEPDVAAVQAGCGAEGYRVVARQWDAVLGRSWELRQACAHPEWPARLAAMSSAGAGLTARDGLAGTKEVAQIVPPLLVHAGDRVRLWMQDERVRIEMSGVVEQSARGGERVVVQIARQSEDAGMTVERISGVVRGAGDVEMER
jgi:hypothetical protein